VRFLLEIGLQTKLLLLAIFGVVILSALHSYLGIHTSREITEIVLRERLASAQAKALATDGVMERAVWELQKLARSAEVDLTDGDLDAERRLLHQVYTEAQLFSGLYLFDRNGSLLLAVPESGGARAMATEHIKEMMPAEGQQPQVAISWDGGDRPIAFLSLPVIHGQGNIAGAVGGSIDLLASPIGALILSAAPGTGAYTELIDQRRIVVMSQRPERRRQPSEEQIQEVLTLAPLNTVPWAIAMRQPEAEVFHTARHLVRRVYLLTGVTLVLALLAVWLSTRLVVRPVKALARSLERMGGAILRRPSPCPC
jgi:hypothetical protein